MVIAHSIITWLPITANWVYSHISGIKSERLILANVLLNADKFPCAAIAYPKNKVQVYFSWILMKFRLTAYPYYYKKIIDKYNPDILHSHFGDRGWSDIGICRIHSMKHVVTFYGYDVNMLIKSKPIWIERYKQLFKKADLFLCEGPYMASCLIRLGCPEEKIKVQHIGIDIKKHPFKTKPIESGKTVRILIAGTFREKKGIPDAIEAVGLLRKKISNVEITVAGDSTGTQKEETEKRRILDVVKKYNMDSICRFIGFQPMDSLTQIAHDHHIFLSPSITAVDGDTEGGAPVTIIEMAANGIPIVSTFHCDIPNIIEHQKSGLLANERDPQELCMMLERLIVDSALRLKLTQGARKRVEEHFDITKQIVKLEKIYTTLLNGRKA